MSDPTLNSWYHTQKRRDNLHATAKRWQGTPFHQNSAVCGAQGGVSCHNYFARIYIETGFLEPFFVPKGSIREMMTTGRNPIGEWIDDHLIRRLPNLLNDYPPEALQMLPGDLLGMVDPTCGIWHYGVVLGHGQFTHVLRHSGVQISMLADTTYQPVKEIRRPQR